MGSGMGIGADRGRAAPLERGSGFSLLELVIVLSLAAILAGAGVLGYQALRSRLYLSMAARQVVLDLRTARTRAVSNHRNYRVIFPSGRGAYQAQRDAAGGYQDDGRPIPLPQGIIITECTGRDESISFVPRGNAGVFGTITLDNGRGEVRHISVNIAGQVRVY